MNQPRISRLTDDEIADADYIESGDDDARPTDEALAYAKFRAELMDGERYAKISVFRQPTNKVGQPSGRKLAFLFECGLDEYEYSQLLTRLRDEHGSGIYRVQARDANGAMLFNRSIAVEASAKPQPNAENRGNDTTALFNAFNNALAEHQNRTEQMIERLMQGRRGNGMDENSLSQFAVMFSLVEKVAGLFATKGGGALAAPDPVADLRRLVEMKNIFGELGIDGGGDGGGKTIHDTLAATITAFAPAINAGLTQLAAQQSQPRRRLPNPNPQAPGAQPAAQTAPQQPEGTPMDYSKQIGLLVMNARAGADVEAVADSILSMTPEDKLPALEAFITAPDVLEQMQKMNPAVSQYLQWFTELRDDLRAYFSGEENPPDLPE